MFRCSHLALESATQMDDPLGLVAAADGKDCMDVRPGGGAFKG